MHETLRQTNDEAVCPSAHAEPGGRWISIFKHFQACNWALAGRLSFTFRVGLASAISLVAAGLD